MPRRKIKLKPIGECYVLSFLEKVKENEGNIEEAYKSMQYEFVETPYFIPEEWWKDIIYTSELPTNYEAQKNVKICGYWLPTAFIDYVG